MIGQYSEEETRAMLSDILTIRCTSLFNLNDRTDVKESEGGEKEERKGKRKEARRGKGRGWERRREERRGEEGTGKERRREEGRGEEREESEPREGNEPMEGRGKKVQKRGRKWDTERKEKEIKG